MNYTNYTIHLWMVKTTSANLPLSFIASSSFAFVIVLKISVGTTTIITYCSFKVEPLGSHGLF